MDGLFNLAFWIGNQINSLGPRLRRHGQKIWRFKTLPRLHYRNPVGFDVFILLVGSAVSAGAQQAVALSSAHFSVVRRSENWQVWERTVCRWTPSGKIASNTESYVECGSGLNFKNSAGDWEPSSENIAILADGSGAATNAVCKAYFPPDIYDGTITLITGQGVKLQSQPLCFVYTEGANSSMVAELTNSIGDLVSSNEIIYPGAFVGPGISADVEYIFHRSGLEQSLIIHSQLPAPEDYGMDSSDPNLRVQLITEFFDCPPPGSNSRTRQPRGRSE